MRIPAAALLCLATLGCAAVRPEEEVIQEAKDKVFPAVVFIKPISMEFRGGKMEKVQVFGSGAIISEDGYVVTNNHVADKATEIRCVLSDKEELTAKIVGLDPETDLAVIKLNLAERKSKQPLPVAEFGDSNGLKVGELVMAMGAPHGFERSVSRGIVSSVERYLDFAPYNLWIQTDAAINPGNSGGPLVDIHGRIVGINARGMRGADNLGFAIPSMVVKDVVARILKDGKVQRAWTGLRFQALKDFRKSSYIDAKQGVLVASVDEDSPAEKAKLRAGDIAVSVNGAPIRGMYETDLPAVERLFAALPVGAPASLEVQRGPELVPVTLSPATKGKQEGEDFECKKWDMTVKEITKFSDAFLHFQRPHGIYIQGVKFAGNARASGFANFDILTQIGDRPIESLKDVREAHEAGLQLEKGKRKLLFRVIRAGYRRLIVLDFEKDMEKIEDD
ncbi:MAG: trypsin-like peptidase domain-containing protein [Planctomycetaceae bacterium]|nr:trypsin-like peptidase domain-containing protein [Planctomycetaceae bacterium]